MIKINSKPKKDNDMHTFSEALEALKECKKVARTNWNGKGMYVYLVPAKVVDNIQCDAFIAMKTVQNTHVPWLASQSDILAEDWMMV